MKLKEHISNVIFITIFIHSSCLDSINLDLPAEKERLVVFGWITNENRPHEITVSRTNDFNNTNPYLPVTGASVYVLSRTDTITFLEDGASGHYFSESFAGIVNEKYELHVETAEGNHIQSSQELLKALPPITSTFIQFSLDPDQVDISVDQDNWFVGGLVDDTPKIENYYRWKIYVNGELRNKVSELTLFDDKFTDGNNFRFDASNVLFLERDKVLLQSMSLNSLAYDYYRQLKNLSGNDITGPIFQFFPLKGNMIDVENEQEEILGFFSASAIEEIEVQ